MDFTVTMNQSDIDNGVKEDCEYCALALAVARAVAAVNADDVVDANGAGAFIRTRNEGGGFRYWAATLPEQCGEFVWVFDKGEPVKPIQPFALRFVSRIEYDDENEIDDAYCYYPGEMWDTRTTEFPPERLTL